MGAQGRVHSSPAPETKRAGPTARRAGPTGETPLISTRSLRPTGPIRPLALASPGAAIGARGARRAHGLAGRARDVPYAIWVGAIRQQVTVVVDPVRTRHVRYLDQGRGAAIRGAAALVLARGAVAVAAPAAPAGARVEDPGDLGEDDVRPDAGVETTAVVVERDDLVREAREHRRAGRAVGGVAEVPDVVLLAHDRRRVHLAQPRGVLGMRRGDRQDLGSAARVARDVDALVERS